MVEGQSHADLIAYLGTQVWKNTTMGTDGTDLGKRQRFVDLLFLVPKVPRELRGITVIASKPGDVAGESASPRTDERSADRSQKDNNKTTTTKYHE